MWRNRQIGKGDSMKLPLLRMAAILGFVRLLTIITEHLRDNLVEQNMSEEEHADRH
jgi:hypothetical protein